MVIPKFKTDEILWVSEKADVSELIIQAFENVSVQAAGVREE